MDEMEIRRRRALYRAQHRGTKEMDIVLGRYATEKLETLSGDELTRFEAFLAIPEPQLDAWIMKGADVGEPEFAAIVADVRKLNGFD